MEPFKAALPRLISAVEDKDDKISSVSMEILRDLGRDARPAVPALIEKVGDAKRNAGLRAAAIGALASVAPEENEVGHVLLAAAHDADRRVRCAAIAALGKGGRASNESVPYLRGLLQDTDAVVAQLAYESLCQIAPEMALRISGPKTMHPSSTSFLTNPVYSTTYTYLLPISALASGASDAELLMLYSTNSPRIPRPK